MKSWLVIYKAKLDSAYASAGGPLATWSGIVYAEDSELAEHVALESIENDSIDPNVYEFYGCSLLEVCTGCGGMRKALSPQGQGAVT